MGRFRAAVFTSDCGRRGQGGADVLGIKPGHLLLYPAAKKKKKHSPNASVTPAPRHSRTQSVHPKEEGPPCCASQGAKVLEKPRPDVFWALQKFWGLILTETLLPLLCSPRNPSTIPGLWVQAACFYPSQPFCKPQTGYLFVWGYFDIVSLSHAADQ